MSAVDSKGAGGAGGCASEERVCGPVGREERSGVVCLPREDVWCRLEALLEALLASGG